MKPVMRVGDMAQGVDSHPVPPGVFPWVGSPAQGAPTVVASGQPAARIGDMYQTSCPICGVGTALTGNPTVITKGQPQHRVGDMVQTPGGFGTAIQGMPSVLG